MEKDELLHKIANLESINDQLSSELKDLNNIALKLGFVNGIEGLKEAAKEVLDFD